MAVVLGSYPCAILTMHSAHKSTISSVRYVLTQTPNTPLEALVRWHFLAPWLTILGLALIDAAWARHAGLTFAIDWSRLGIAMGVMTAIALYYGGSGRSHSLANMAYYVALWIAFTAVAAVLTYVAATIRRPLCDEEFTAFDSLLGFDWITWFRYVAQYSWLRFGLALAYSSLIPQIVLSIIYFSHIGRARQNAELFWAALVSLLFSTAISAAWPAAAAGGAYGLSVLEGAVHLPHFIGLRDGSLSRIDVAGMQGIITFPSYHTVLAILITYAFRQQTTMLAAIGMLNLAMLFAIPPFGYHYLADMLAGACVAIVSIVLVRRIFHRPSELSS